MSGGNNDPCPDGPEDDYPIYVKTLTGKTIQFWVTGGTKVKKLKRKIQDREGVPVNQQRLVFKGKAMEDDKTMYYYNVEEDDIVHLVVTARGG